MTNINTIKCYIAGCDKEIKAYTSRGMCRMHYCRWWRHGDPNHTQFDMIHTKNKIEAGIWSDIKKRCHNSKTKSFKDYGGRGIKVCDRWLGKDGFKNFLEDMGKRPSKDHSIDRIDVNGDYEPDNCRWATKSEQAFNRRVNNPTGYSGIYKTKYNTWRANYANRYLGTFKTLEDAVQKRNEFSKARRLIDTVVVE